MDAQTLILNIYRKATGELDTSITPDSDDGQTILSIINEQVDTYYSAIDQYGVRIIWGRNVDPDYVVGTANLTDTQYEVDWSEVEAVPTGFYAFVRISGVRYDLVPFHELYDDRHLTQKVCAITANGLTFNAPPTEAGDILLPVILKGRHLTGTERDVQAITGVHNILWLQMASAAEYVRTDIVRGAQYPNVLAQANDIFARMIEDNEARTTPVTYDNKGMTARNRTIYEW
jgi:hypothetical protein